MPGADAVELRGDTVLVQANDSNAVARYLLDTTPARDLEITARNLEDAFLALVTSSTDAPGATEQPFTDTPAPDLQGSPR